MSRYKWLRVQVDLSFKSVEFQSAGRRVRRVGLGERLRVGARDVQSSRCWADVAPVPGLGQRKTPVPQGRDGRLGAVTMLLVTGGAGFIGSNVVARLNEAGRTDVVVNDTLGAAG